MRRLAVVSVALATLGCSGMLGGDVVSEYEAAKSEAMAEPAVLQEGESWSADARVEVAHGLVAEVLKASASSLRPSPVVVDTPLGKVSATPTVTITSARVTQGQCDKCIDVAIEAKGSAAWQAGPLKGNAPYTAELGAGVVLSSRQAGSSFALEADVTTVKAAHVVVNASSMGIDLGGLLEDYLEDALVNDLGRVTLAEVDGAALGLRAMDVGRTGNSVFAELLTDANEAAAVPASSGLVASSGWSVSISEASLLSLARKEAFKSQSKQVVEPTGLSMTHSDFTLEIRVWQLDSPAWWRTYEVTGRVAITPAGLKLTPSDARAVDGSTGSGVVDAVGAVVGTDVLDIISEALSDAIPLPDKADVGGTTFGVNIAKISGSNGMITMSGTAEVGGQVPRGRAGAERDHKGGDRTRGGGGARGERGDRAGGDRAGGGRAGGGRGGRGGQRR